MGWLKIRMAKTTLVQSEKRFRRLLRIELLEDRCVPSTVTPTTFDDGGMGSGSLRDAILQFNTDAGTDDDIIQLEAGTYSLTIPNTSWHQSGGLDGDLYLTQTSHRWIIQGTGPSTIIDASKLQDRAFQIANPGTRVVFQGLVIQGGLAQDDGTRGARPGTTDALGGGILNNGGDLTLDDVVLQNNAAQGGDAAVKRAAGYSARGAAIFSTGGVLTIAGTMIVKNHTHGGRGGDSSGSNRAGDGGSGSGGGLYASGGSLDISDSSIVSNRATGGRGGDGGPCQTTGCGTGGFGGQGGSAQGGGLFVSGGSLTIASSTIASNQGSGGSFGLHGLVGFGEGGGLYSNGTLTVSNSTLSDNSATDDGSAGIDGFGGGIWSGGTLTVSNSALSGNVAHYWGGGIYNSGTLTFMGSALSGNSAYFSGGGIYNVGTLTVRGSALSGNSTLGYGGGDGGGIYNIRGTLTVSSSTLSGNSAGGTFSSGGGIWSAGTLTVNTSTLSGNRAGTGGGLAGIGSPVLHSTLVASNFRGATGTTRDDIFGALDPGGDYNLIGDGTGMTGLSDGVNGNQVGSADAPIDPLLGPLQDNGGPTQTMALLSGSPALDAGDPGQLGSPDQRGVVRSGGVNIGAYQASATSFLLSAPDTVQSGVPFDVTVTAVDPFGQVAVGYIGTVTFSTSDPDPAVALPADYSFTANDSGLHTFTDTGLGETTLLTPGDQMLTIADTADGTITGSATITVDSGGSAPALDGSPRAFGRGTTRAATAVQNVRSSATNAAVERYFAALAEGQSTFPGLRWLHRKPGESAGCMLDLCREEELLFI